MGCDIVGPSRPASILTCGVNIRADTGFRRMSSPITCGDYPAPKNPFYGNETNELGSGVLQPTKPLYDKSWEERMEDRRRTDEHMRRVQQIDMERTGLAALGYTHNGLDPVPPLFVDTNAIRGRGRSATTLLPNYLFPKETKPFVLPNFNKPLLETPKIPTIFESRKDIHQMQYESLRKQRSNLSESDCWLIINLHGGSIKKWEEAEKSIRKTMEMMNYPTPFHPKSWQTVSDGDVKEKVSLNYPERIFDVPKLNFHAHIGVTKSGEEFLAGRPSDDPTSEHFIWKYPHGFFPDLQTPSLQKKEEVKRDDKGNAPDDPDYCPAWIRRDSMAHWLYKRWK